MVMKKIVKGYEKNLPKLMFIPLILLVIAIAYLGLHYAQTGEVFKKDISLRGGIVATVDLIDDPILPI